MIAPHVERNYRWNFRILTVETSLWMFSTALIDTTTVLPVLVQSLSGSPFLASLLLSIRYAGQGLPQLISASLVSRRSYRKSYYFAVALPGRLLLLWPAAILLLGIDRPAIAVSAVLLASLAFWVSEGFSIVPWVDMVGKTIPSTRRGTLFAFMHIIGGLLGIMAGGFVRQMLQGSSLRFPVGYGVLFALSLLVILLSTTAILFLREPPSPAHEERYSTRALIKDIPNLLRGQAQFRLLIILQSLFGFAILPAPFYILFASDILQRTLPPAAAGPLLGVGFFLSTQTAGLIVGNAVWGHLADRYGSRLVLRALAVAHILVPLCAALAGLITPRGPNWLVYAGFMPVFFGFGAVSSGTWLAVTNFLLDIAPEHDRPAYIAVTNALNLPAVILPMVGGLLLRVVGYQAIFLTAALFLLYALYLTRALCEPRTMHPHPHAPHPGVEEFDTRADMPDEPLA